MDIVIFAGWKIQLHDQTLKTPEEENIFKQNTISNPPSFLCFCKVILMLTNSAKTLLQQLFKWLGLGIVVLAFLIFFPEKKRKKKKRVKYWQPLS
jgi:hypothetical protein